MGRSQREWNHTFMIEIQSLTKRFGQFMAVDSLSLTIHPGEVIGFLGPNGAGKSTTMRMIAGFLKPDSGRVTIFGQDIELQPLSAKRLLGYLPEGAPSYGDMSVESFLRFIAEARGVARQQRQSAIDRVVNRLHLQEVRRRPIDTLSKGFQRRVGIAQALLHDPQVLLLDEPTDGLDPNQKYEVRELIRELASDKIVIISTHILEEVEAVCQRAVIIHQGRLVADATPAELKMQSDYYQAVELELPNISTGSDLWRQLEQLPGVKAITRTETGQWLVMPQQGEPILQPVQAILEARSVTPHSIAVSNGRLDDVFRRVTQDPAGHSLTQAGGL